MLFLDQSTRWFGFLSFWDNSFKSLLVRLFEICELLVWRLVGRLSKMFEWWISCRFWHVVIYLLESLLSFILPHWRVKVAKTFFELFEIVWVWWEFTRWKLSPMLILICFALRIWPLHSFSLWLWVIHTNSCREQVEISLLSFIEQWIIIRASFWLLFCRVERVFLLVRGWTFLSFWLSWWFSLFFPFSDFSILRGKVCLCEV